MGGKAEPTRATIGIDVRPPIGRSGVWGLQHVLAMFAGMVAVPLAVGTALGLTDAERTVLVQGAMFASGIGTILQAVGVGPIGARLPIVMGTAFVFIAPMISIGGRFGVPAIMGALIVAGLAELVIAFVVWRIRHWFPPIVTGTVVTLIGLGLIPLAFFWTAGGTVAFGEPRSYVVGGLVLFLLILINRFGGGFSSSLAIVGAITIGYGLAAVAGLLNLGPVVEEPWVSLPNPLAFGVPEFHLGAILGILIAQFASMLETIGDTFAIGGATGKRIEAKELRGAIAADGLASALAPFVNGFAVTSFSQNIGVISLTGIASRFVVGLGGVFLLLFALLPRFASVIALMPDPVLGGAALAMFGAVAAAGVNILRRVELRQREVLIFAVAIALGLGVATRPEGAFEEFPETLRIVLESAVAVGGITAILLDRVLPERAPAATDTEA